MYLAKQKNVEIFAILMRDIKYQLEKTTKTFTDPDRTRFLEGFTLAWKLVLLPSCLLNHVQPPTLNDCKKTFGVGAKGEINVAYYDAWVMSNMAGGRFRY